MTVPRQWEIWWVEWKYEDEDVVEVRPALVLTDSGYHDRVRSALCAKISTKLHQDDHLDLAPSEFTRLAQQSYLYLRRTQVIPLESFRTLIGVLPQDLQEEVDAYYRGH